ncbi:hypothetical protein FOL47_003012 [Perkinsus chesapeaki]|uniref:Uncharacterized protein n=1 Tax=Perkinsus chesapeaki TaxID=330153 RepID=A0A7J6N183_PERCH|nr:hypothetical protein FOL47_003012 [Perkinsus chesapeaki]
MPGSREAVKACTDEHEDALVFLHVTDSALIHLTLHVDSQFILNVIQRPRGGGGAVSSELKRQDQTTPWLAIGGFFFTKNDLDRQKHSVTLIPKKAICSTTGAETDRDDNKGTEHTMLSLLPNAKWLCRRLTRHRLLPFSCCRSVSKGLDVLIVPVISNGIEHLHLPDALVALVSNSWRLERYDKGVSREDSKVDELLDDVLSTTRRGLLNLSNENFIEEIIKASIRCGEQGVENHVSTCSAELQQEQVSSEVPLSGMASTCSPSVEVCEEPSSNGAIMSMI